MYCQSKYLPRIFFYLDYNEAVYFYIQEIKMINSIKQNKQEIPQKIISKQLAN